MRDLSLHILDLIENSVRAGASTVFVAIDESPAEGTLKVTIEDNGPGLSVTPEQAADPFYTTKPGKKTGLGLGFFRASVEAAGGAFMLRRSRLGGLAVEGVMQIGHVDRIPLGDLALTISSVVCTNPKLDLRCRISANGKEHNIAVSEVAEEFPAPERDGLAVARCVSQRIKAGLADLSVSE
ncbi:MAG TPA: ATP-binding protein [Candidatus Brocadiia bacterium]|nr:ATP-binding protein [Candidatus Brocadiia bacterium]